MSLRKPNDRLATPVRELPNRRAGRLGSSARGFFVWNSAVGKTALGAGFFLFDYVLLQPDHLGRRSVHRSTHAL
jgi:hypothetical protein